MGDGQRTRMRGLFTGLAFAVIAVSVIWLLTKMSRTEAADWRLTVLGITVAMALLALIGGIAKRPGRRRRP